MIKLSFPFTEEKIRALKVGDEVTISSDVETPGLRKIANWFYRPREGGSAG